MKLHSIRYLFREGCKNVWVNRLMSIASIGVLTACMVMIGLALLISTNVEKIMDDLEQQNVVMVYFNDENSLKYGDAKPILSDGEKFDPNNILESHYLVHNKEEAEIVCAVIKNIPNVSEAEYISKEDALNEVKDTMLEGQEEYFEFLDEEGGNPLSDGARVQLEDMTKFDETVQKIKQVKGVDVVRCQDDMADKIVSVKKGISVAGIWIIAILLVISLVIVSNTIRVTMYNRKLQIGIMKAVGATDSFIRIPFIIEGILIGLISSLFAEGIVYFCYRVAIDSMVTSLDPTQIIPFADVAWILLGVFAVIGVFAGLFGSAIMIGKYLRKEGSEFSAI